MPRRTGFVLIELIIVLAIISILIISTTKGYYTITTHFQTWAESSRLYSLIQQTRNLAVTHSTHAILCPSTNQKECISDWHQVLIQFLDKNNNKKRDDNEPLQLVVTPFSIDGREITYPRTMINFDKSGRINGFTGTLAYCSEFYTRGIVLSRVGRIRNALDLNGDGIPDKDISTPISCD